MASDPRGRVLSVLGNGGSPGSDCRTFSGVFEGVAAGRWGRRWQSTRSAGWPCARAARRCSGSAPPAIEVTCTAARAAPSSPAARANAAHDAATDTVSRADSTIAIERERDAGAVARALAWGITLPRARLPRSGCSPRQRRPFPMHRSFPQRLALQSRACAAPAVGGPCAGSRSNPRVRARCASPAPRPLPESRP